MKKGLNSIYFAVFVLTICSFVYSSKTFAGVAEVAHVNVPINKKWTIDFSREVDVSSVTSDSIYIEDSKGNRLPLDVTFLNGNKSLLVRPIDTYQYNEIYTLTITNKVTSQKKETLPSNKVVRFKTEEKLASHPRALISQAQVERAQSRIQAEQWARNYWLFIKRQADSWLQADIAFPSKGAGHPSWYMCKNGQRLEYNQTKNSVHFCPSENKHYSGEEYDAGWRFHRVEELVIGMRHLANAYVLSGEQKYAIRAKEMLLNLASRYPQYQQQSRGGKLFWQTLDEAVAFVDIAYTYDLIYESGVLTKEEKNKIESNVFYPASETINANKQGRSNWQAWHNAAIGMIGFVVGDRSLIKEAIEGENGFHYLLEHGVKSDGFWWEGSIAYHMYTLTALHVLAEAAKSWGYDLYGHPKLKKMFDAPIYYAYPDLRLPTNNNGGTFGQSLIGSVSSRGYYEYEAAYAHYQDPAYGWLLSEKYRATNPRRGDFALFLGADKLPTNTNIPLSSRNFDDIGHAVLRSGNGNKQTYVLLDYGAHGGAHGHFDKLHIDLYGLGNLLAPDFGTPGYHHPLHQPWYIQTISHNTVVVNERSQAAATGKLHYFFDEGPFQLVYASANDAYSVEQYERMVWNLDSYVLDWFRVSDPKKENIYDWVFHGLGQFHSTLPFQPSTILTKYPSIQQVKRAQSNTDWIGKWTQNNVELQMISLTTEPVSIFQGKSPGVATSPTTLTDTFIQRKVGTEADFITIFQPTFKNENVLQARRVGKFGVKVEINNEQHQLYWNRHAKQGELIAGKAVVTKKETNNYFESVTAQMQGDTFHITTNQERYQSISFVYATNKPKQVQLNGRSIPFTHKGGFLFIHHEK